MNVAASPKNRILHFTLPEFEAAIRKEFIESSAIDPQMFNAVAKFASDTEFNHGGDACEPIAEFLNWDGKRSQAGFSSRQTYFAVLLYNEDGLAWQAKLSFERWDREKNQYSKTYNAPKDNGSRGYLPIVPPEIREKVSQHYGVIVPTVGSFWDWLENHPEVSIVITEGAKKSLASFSCGVVTIALYGHPSYSMKENGSTRLIPELQRFCQDGREFTIALDQDDKPKTRASVSNSIAQLSALLSDATGSPVKVTQWNHKQGKGLDDLIVNQGVDTWLEVLSSAIEPTTVGKNLAAPLLTPDEWHEDLEALKDREKTDSERYDELFDDRPLSEWIGEDAAQHYNVGFDSSNNIFVAAAWTHLVYLGALMPANLKTYKLPNRFRDREDISINSIVFIAADRNGGKSTARGIVSKSFGEMVLSQIQSEWVKEALRAKKDSHKAEKGEEGGSVREPNAYDSGCPRVELGDTTIAALSKSIGVNEHYRKEFGAPSFGGIVTLDEGADFLNSNGMLEVKNRNPGFSFLNGAWSGTIAGRSRISTGESGNAINHVNLNFLLPLQTDKFKALVAHPAFASSGLNSRVICIPLRKIANSQTDLPSLTLDQVMSKLKAPKTRNLYPNQEIIRAIGNVRRRLADQDNEVGWSEAAIAKWLEFESCFIDKTVDSSSEEATMRQRSYEDNVAKCAAMGAVSDAVYAPGSSDFEAPPFGDDASGATEAHPSQGIIAIEAHHVSRALDMCKLSLMAQTYFWEKTAPDRERAIAASSFNPQQIAWVEIFNDPAQLRGWVRNKQESGLDTPRRVIHSLNGSTRKLLKQAGINAQEAIKAVWD